VKQRTVRVLLVLLLVLVPLSTVVKSASANNPVFATIKQVQQMIAEALAPVQETLENLSGRLTTAENTLEPIPTEIVSLQLSSATMSAAIADLQARVAVLETAPQSSCISAPSGLISWWPADGNANDISDGNSGSLQNGTTFAPGKVSQAFSLDGVDDFVQGGTVGLPTGNHDRTIDLWVNINSFLADVTEPHSPLETFFAGYGNFGSANQAYALGTAGNVLYFSQWGNAIFGPSLQTNRWYHVAVTNSGNSATLFLDGVAVASGNLTIDTPVGTNFYIGKIPDPLGTIRRLDGQVDEVEVFNRALTSSEIQAIFQAGSKGKCKPSTGLSDDFNGPNLDMNIWEVFPNGGTFSFENGFLVIPGGNAIPLFRAKINPFPASGPFTVEFGIQYTVVNQSGSGVAVSLLQQQNTCDWSNSPVAFWQGNNFGLQVVSFGLTQAVIGSNPDLNSHIGKIVYDGEKYRVFRDGSLVYTSPLTARATGLWFGHFSCQVNAPWTGFKLDYIRVTAQ